MSEMSVTPVAASACLGLLSEVDDEHMILGAAIEPAGLDRIRRGCRAQDLVDFLPLVLGAAPSSIGCRRLQDEVGGGECGDAFQPDHEIGDAIAVDVRGHEGSPRR